MAHEAADRFARAFGGALEGIETGEDSGIPYVAHERRVVGLGHPLWRADSTSSTAPAAMFATSISAGGRLAAVLDTRLAAMFPEQIFNALTS